MACVTDLRNERNMSAFTSSLVPNKCVLYVGKHWSAVAFPRKRLLSLVPDTCEVTCPQRRLLCRNLNALTGIHFMSFWSGPRTVSRLALRHPFRGLKMTVVFQGNTTVCIDSLFFDTYDICFRDRMLTKEVDGRQASCWTTRPCLTLASGF